MHRLSAHRTTHRHTAERHTDSHPGTGPRAAGSPAPRAAGRRRAVLLVAAPLFVTAAAVTPASAHGAPTDPVSRVSACSPEGGARAGSAACRAAVAANGAPFTAWDNLRIAGVNGRDRQIVPDGKLCSGGLAAYRGLDLARADWPATRLTPGGTLKLTYRSTIPHTGTFKLFLTKPGYDPAKPLTWSDLPERPFASVTDPPLRDGSYRFSAKLPADRSGHHVLYTIWQNTSTVDTYYSCSDVVFPAATKAGPDAGGKRAERTPDGSGQAAPSRRPKADTPSPTPTPTPSREPSSASGRTPAGGGAEVAGSSVASTSDDSGTSVPLVAGGAAAMVLATGAALFLRGRRRR
ncbi:lytic polysaccharide monooxygenase auxiliary activity family 9 protein [Streptomyces sp. HM190]|uniref:lytic polysaccharide monooxygenase auxiliary activity family 9 protein n=1 Tax=Streptomyces sp. HM190 TaxID=2695266 RepID=UPI001F233508|nr:lytic polysaccharide monooxygenase [Streptomyces sp. HM190]